ncbi:ABC transporter transmembrane domain-containing protein [Kordiimonas lipolytica]|uniref:ABC transporter transmembrane domain-containing protein n=1 Tax=Kordiimonas lipolytica TaxID=1662421 RepID=A0ABV8UBQ1_9PROT|nr:ABC transporter ATP-binding protein [Kordiimonas lipolytica]
MSAPNPPSAASSTNLSEVYAFLRSILGPEKSFYKLAAVYGVGISLLSLAVPVSVQMLINTVANIGLAAPLVVLATVLFVLLLVSGLLNALRIHLMEIFSRRFYARMVAEISLRTLYAQNPFFADNGKNPLFNRYFDIVIIQKSVPYLLIGGFTVVLQALVGFVIVSLYHPLFLVFNITLCLLIWLIWAMWGKKAIKSAIEQSHKKHAVAAWVEDLGASNGYYKSSLHIERALKLTDAKTADYIASNKAHFRYSFSQTLAFLLIYAAASAALLGLGGWLTILGQLSLGQLVAAELILSAVFFGISQLGVYLASFYDIIAAVEELSHFYSVPQEVPRGTKTPLETNSVLSFDNAQGFGRDEKVTFNLTIGQGDVIFCGTKNHGIQRLFTDLLKHHVRPDGGIVSIGGIDVLDIEVHELRQIITILDRPTVINATIRDFLRYAGEEKHSGDTLDILDQVGLRNAVTHLKNGLDTEVSTTGAPLSLTEVLKLKLAAALISGPKVLVLNQLFDIIPENTLVNILALFRERWNTTVIYFSNRDHALGFEKFLYLGADTQSFFTSFETFKQELR